MNAVTFLIKPASSLCNMRCKYCFYEDISQNRSVKSMGIMAQETACQIIEQGLQTVSPGGSILFMFQGGEPTLAGLPFFESFVSHVHQCNRKSARIQYAIQTNGVVLNAHWAAFFKKHNFLVGLSIDGTADIHDHFRGNWEQTVSALQLLEAHGVETNLLSVVTAQMAKKPEKVYRSLTKLGSHALQFIPCLDPLDGERGGMEYSLTPEGYASFLRRLFDCWYRDWKGGHYVSIRNFEDYLYALLRLPPSSCSAAGSCGHYLVVEGDGSLYPCDFYVLDQWRIGNIQDMTVAQALDSPVSRRFVEESRIRPAACRTCCYAPLCRGGCKRDWTPQNRNYYCDAFRSLLDYALPRLEEMAMQLVRRR